MSEKIIEVSGLQKSYKENHVLKDVSFTIDKGSIFALLGSNGAGKTTVIKILSTLLKADGGSAVVNGFNVATNGDNVRECISLTGQFVAVDEVDVYKRQSFFCFLFRSAFPIGHNSLPFFISLIIRQIPSNENALQKKRDCRGKRAAAL